MPYRILTLDGGGAWALIEVKVLIDLFGGATRGNEVLAKFDLVAANSGGSIVLGGLMEDLTLNALLDLFMDATKRAMIFSPTTSLGDKALELAVGMGPKYSAANKLVALETLLPQTGKRPIAGITENLTAPGGGPVRLLIVGFDYDLNRATFFRSVAGAGACLGICNPADVTLAEAIHASTDAPVNYFDAPATFPERTERYWDGGISGFNNPVVAAVTEAVVHGTPPGAIAALSLGTGTVRLPLAPAGAPSSAFTQGRKDASLLADLGKLASAILDDPPDSASFIAHAMTMGDGAFPAPAVSRVVRMSPLVAPQGPPEHYTAPAGMTPAAFQYLCNIDMDAMKVGDVPAISAYADAWIGGRAPNQLIHTDEAEPPFSLGYATYPDAKAAWRAVSS